MISSFFYVHYHDASQFNHISNQDMKYILSLLMIFALGVNVSASTPDVTGNTSVSNAVEITVESDLNIDSSVVNAFDSTTKMIDDNYCCYESKAGRNPGSVSVRFTSTDGTTGNWRTYDAPLSMVVGNVPKCIIE